MHVDKHYLLRQLYSVSSGLKTYLVIWNGKGTVIVSCVPNTRFDHVVILSSVKGSESFYFSCTEHELIYKLTFVVYSCRNHSLF